MRERLLLNVLLLTGVAALAFWLWRDTPPVAPVSELAPAAVQRIAVERRGERSLELVRADSGWRLQVPRELPASQQHLELLLGFLQLPVTARYPSAEVDLAGAGLIAPLLTVSFNESRYVFGGLDPLGQQRYLLHEDEVLLVREGVSALLISPWWNFIDRRLLPEGEPRRLHFSDGETHTLTPDEPRTARWQHGAAAIVRPWLNEVRGEVFELELVSGQRLPWQWLDGEQPGLLRPDLGLVYQLSAEQLNELLGRQ